MTSAITLLKKSIKQRINNKEPYSQKMANSLAIEMYKASYGSQMSEEAFAYQRGLANGISVILSIFDEILKEEI